MKDIIYKYIAIAVLMVCISQANAQSTTPTTSNYQIAADLKFGGYENGISGKYFFKENTAIEAVLGFRSHGVVITALYEIHQVALMYLN